MSLFTVHLKLQGSIFKIEIGLFPGLMQETAPKTQYLGQPLVASNNLRGLSFSHIFTIFMFIEIHSEDIQLFSH